MASGTHNKAERQKNSLAMRAKAPLAAHFEDCSQESSLLADAVQANRPHSHKLLDLAEDCRDRLALWGDNSGATSRTLDYSLKCAPSLARQTQALLEELKGNLKEAASFIRPHLSEADTPYDLFPKTEEDDGGLDVVPDGQDIVDANPAMWLTESLDVVDCLFGLLPAFHSPLDDDEELPPAPGSDQYFEAGSVQWHIQTATELFPAAPRQLVERLGNCNWRRRRHLRRLQERPRTAASPSTVASNLHPEPARQTNGHARNQALGSLTRQRPPNSIISSKQSTWADRSDTATSMSQITSILSRTLEPDQTSATSITGSQHPISLPPLALPEPPADLDKQVPFDCPICRFELPLAVSATGVSHDEWEEHVYLDLKPYICTFYPCNLGNLMFGAKSDWLQHELDVHRSSSTFFCGLCRLDSFDSQNEFREHLATSHRHLDADTALVLLESCKRYSQKPAFLDCHLCGHTCSDLPELGSHVGQHLEYFALSSLLEDDLILPEEVALEDYSTLHEYLDELPHGHGPLAPEAKATRDSSGPDREPQAPEAKTIRASSGPPTENGVGQASAPASRAAELSEVAFLEDAEKEYPFQNTQWERAEKVTVTEKITKFLTNQAEVPAGPEMSNVPTRDTKFFGRDDDLARMHASLSNMGRICTISGRGGVGKTAIAREYLHRFRHEYAYIFWVEAENPGVLQEKYNMMASVLIKGDKPPPDDLSCMILVRECLTRAERRWLLVLDNVKQWLDISRYVPKSLLRTRGSVLVTSRGSSPLLQMPSSQHQDHVHLAPWTLDHSREFLLTNISKSLKRENLQSHDEYDLAELVVNKVDRLPLAVNIVVGYIKVSRCTLQEFLYMWEEREARRRPKRRNLASHKQGIDPTIDSLWEIGIGEVRANCRKLLDILSFFASDTIQKSLLVGPHEEEYLDFLHEEEVLRYKRMIEQLDRQKLIGVKIDNGEEAYVIHRVLQDKIQSDLDNYSFADAFRKAFRLLRKHYPVSDPQQVPVPKQLEVCKKIMPHVQAFHVTFSEHANHHGMASIGEVDPIDLAGLFYDAGFFVWGGQSTAYDGLPLLETATRILTEMKVDPNAKLRADINCIHGLLLLNMGYVERRTGADKLEAAWEIRKKLYDQNETRDNDVLSQNAANDWCICLMNMYRFHEAKTLLQGCLTRYKMWGSEEDNPFEYSKFYGNYSVVLLWEGKVQEAIEYCQKCLVLTEKFGQRKSQYYRRLFFLGCLHLQAGEYQKALETHMETLKERIALQGKHHENTIMSMYAVAVAFHYLGHLGEAIDTLIRCIGKAQSAPQWPEEALGRAKYHLAVLYEERGGDEDREEALKLKEEARKVIDKFRKYTPQHIQDTGDEMMMFNDMQGTFTGRYTGIKLLKHIQTHPLTRVKESES